MVNCQTAIFPLGQVVTTRSIAENMEMGEIADLLQRHACGDWGIPDKDDWISNYDALKNGTRILSAYHNTNGDKVWIITEADRSATTVLYPHEY